MSARHWTEDYLGLRYAKGGDDPAGFNCWGFFRHVELRHFGIRVPIVAEPEKFSMLLKKVPATATELGWEKVTVPRGGDAVLMSSRKHPSHVGIWVDDLSKAAVLHCVEGSGSALHTREHLRIGQWRIIAFYRPFDMAAAELVVPGRG